MNLKRPGIQPLLQRQRILRMLLILVTWRPALLCRWLRKVSICEKRRCQNVSQQAICLMLNCKGSFYDPKQFKQFLSHFRRPNRGTNLVQWAAAATGAVAQTRLHPILDNEEVRNTEFP